MAIDTNVWVVRMRRKYVTIEVSYDTEETWQEAKKEIEEIMDLLNNIKRRAKIIEIEQGVDIDEA